MSQYITSAPEIPSPSSKDQTWATLTKKKSRVRDRDRVAILNTPTKGTGTLGLAGSWLHITDHKVG